MRLSFSFWLNFICSETAGLKKCVNFYLLAHLFKCPARGVQRQSVLFYHRLFHFVTLAMAPPCVAPLLWLVHSYFSTLISKSALTLRGYNPTSCFPCRLTLHDFLHIERDFFPPSSYILKTGM